MLIKEKIKTIRLSEIERNIIRFIEDHEEELHHISTRDIATGTYCSASNVIRLSNKLGFSGYNEMKDAWIKERDYLNTCITDTDFNIPFTKDDSIMQVVNSIGNLHTSALQDTISLLDQKELKKISECLNRSEHIMVFGFGAYVPLATIFAQKMSRIRKHVIVQNHVGEENYQLDLLTEKDCAIIISYSGENVTMIDTARLLKQKKVPIIAITSIGENTLSTLSTHLITISSREKIYRKIGNFATEESVLYILNVFYSLCFRQQYDKNLEYKINRARDVEYNHFSSNNYIYDDRSTE